MTSFTAEELAAISRLTDEITAARRELARDPADHRRPSKASLIGGIQPPLDGSGWGLRPDKPSKPSKFLMKALDVGGRYRPGQLVEALWKAHATDYDEQRQAKAKLAEFGLRWADIPELSTNKATLGTTGPTGGYVLPNNLVDSVQKPKVAEAVYSNLCTVIPGISVRGVDQPYRTGAPPRATFQNWGATKENLDEAYGTYSALLGTLARVYDVGKQYLRFSAGAAEQDVMDELVKSIRLGENYYILAGQGSGTSTPGVNDPTVGVYTALTASSPTFTTTFTGAANNTLIGSFGEAVSVGLKAMAARARIPTGIVTDAITYFNAMGQGTDAAGFWVSPTGYPSVARVNTSGQLEMFGIPVFWDPNFDVNTGTTKAAIMADWPAFRLYRGMEFRIDTTDIAGDRWDKNLVGFRGEEELGFHAGTGVAIGAAQLILNAIP